MTRAAVLLVTFAVLCGAPSRAKEPTAAERGYKALTGTAFIPAFWTPNALPNVWKQWGAGAKPADYDAAVMDRYGLHPAPYPNDGLPMGLRKAPLLLKTGVGADCMLCHAGSIFGKSYVGLGNSSLDIHSLFEDLARADGIAKKLPFTFSNARGTNEAGAFGVYLLGFRNPDLSLKGEWTDLDLRDDLCEDVPAWWHMRKKKTIYYGGATDSRSVRTLMQFMMHPLNPPKEFERHEPAFRDILEHLVALEPPKYPFAVDAALAAKGEKVFSANCAKCHGTYGEKWSYPNKVIALDEIGTDPARYRGITEKYGKAYLESWFGKEGGGVKPIRIGEGYQAPPLDGVWATAPYLHNGSVPTLEGVLNSKARPKRFTRSFRTGEADYDKVNVGWKTTDAPEPPARASGWERRKVYDTSKPGRGNGGHTYGDHLTAEQRAALIEYLKTL